MSVLTNGDPAGPDSGVANSGRTQCSGSNLRPGGDPSLSRPGRSLQLTIRAHGQPIPEGSKSATIRGGRAVMFDANPRLREWRRTVTKAAVNAMTAARWVTLDGPVDVVIELRMPRPRTVAIRRRPWPHTKGIDLDKGVRACLDSLTDAGVWVDDCQAVRITAEKRYADDGRPPGATIRVTAITEQEVLL